MDDDAVERRRGLLGLEAPPRRFPGWKRVLAIMALLATVARRGGNRMKAFLTVFVSTGLGAMVWRGREALEAIP